MILRSRVTEKKCVVIFGTGVYYQNRKHTLKRENIVAFLDNSKEKQGAFLDSTKVYPPSEIVKLEYELVIIMAGDHYKEEMCQQLLELGVAQEKIIIYERYIELYKNSCLIINNSSSMYKTEKKVLMISHELTNTGAPIVLLYFAEVLKKNGYSPVIMCSKDGELKDDIVANDIPVIIVDNLTRRNRFVWDWVESFDLIILNTLLLKGMVEELSNQGQKVLWWLHEADNEYEACGKESLPEKIGENISVFAVGERAISAYKKHMGNENVSELIYGLPDFRVNEASEKYGKLVFAIIGTIMGRKGHDIFVDAIQYLSEEDRKQAEFWIIGRIVEPDIYEHVSIMAKDYGEIKIIGSLSQEEMRRIYNEIDVVVAPSRMDPMPVVLTEGMMNHKVCIASEMTGTAALISEKVNGLVCKVDAMNLAEQIEWVLNHRYKLKEIGDNARILYEQKFGMETFESNILRILDV